MEDEYFDMMPSTLPNTQTVDCTDTFTTSEVFPTRDDLLNWAKGVGRQIGIVIVIFRSDTYTGRVGRKSKLILSCERSGRYRPWNKRVSSKATGSRKCECPFRLRGRPLKGGEGWIVNVMCGIHNHDLAETLVGHSFVGRLSMEEKSLVCDMTKNLVKPRNILLTLKDHNAESLTTIKQVYNYRCTHRASERGSRTEMQHLLSLLDNDKYVYWYRRVDGSDIVRDIFWTHPDAVTLLNTYHIVLLLDSTYKTNRYRLPLLEVVSVTSTGLTFSVAFAYMESERVDNFIWALQNLRGLITRNDSLPQVILTDRDIALMNAVAAVFPTSVNLLCQFHIRKNVKAKCMLNVFPNTEINPVMDAWDDLTSSIDEGEYAQRLVDFEHLCSRFYDFWDYVQKTWLLPHKEKFVTAWINRVMHLGNTTTNRVEAAHSRFKKLLQDSRGDLCICFGAMNNMLILQHTEIKASLQHSIFITDHRHNTPFYKHLRGFVSKTALDHIADEYRRVNDVGIDSSVCGCTIRTTHGLPCACQLAIYIRVNASVPLDVVHNHWRRLNFNNDSTNEPDFEISIHVELEALQSRFQQLDEVGKIHLKAKLRELAFPHTTSMCPPPNKVKTKGAPKKGKGKCKVSNTDYSTKREPSFWEHVDDAFCSVTDSTSVGPTCKPSVSEPLQTKFVPMIHELPVQIHQYIEDIIDVVPDGNCGHRCIAALLGRGQDSWPLIRQELLSELREFRDDYEKLFDSSDIVEEMKQSLYVSKVAHVGKWMTLPEMGYVIATRYNVVLVSLAKGGSSTFFPLRGRPPLSQSSHRIICIGFVYESHWVQVYLKTGSPIPSTILGWFQHCSAEARPWESPYVSRMQAFERLCRRTHIKRTHIDLGDD